MEAGAFALTARDLQFLREVSDTIRRKDDERAIMRHLAAMIGEYFGVSRCMFGDLDATGVMKVASDYHVPELLSAEGVYPPSTFTPTSFARLLEGLLVVYPAPDVTPAADLLEDLQAMRLESIVCVPFLRDGQLAGVLMITQTTPRAWTARELSLLTIAGDRVWLAIELHRELHVAERELRAATEQLERRVRERTAALSRSEANFRAMIEAAPFGVMVHHGEIDYVNPALCAILGRADARMLLGKHFDALAHPDDLAVARERARRAMNGRPNPPLELRLLDARGGTVWVESTSLQCIYDGRVSAAVMFRDVTERRQADLELERRLGEKEVLLKEIHHRVKNNLQVVSSLLYLQSRRIDDPVARERLEESQARVRSISLVHELLYRSKDLSVVDLREYVDSLLGNLAIALDAGARGIEVCNQVEPSVRLTIDSAIASGLILCELVTNALKHAFPGGRRGRVDVTVQRANGAIELAVADDGVGLPAAFDTCGACTDAGAVAGSPDPAVKATLGLELVTTLTHQLRGRLAIHRTPGTRFVVSFQGGADA